MQRPSNAQDSSFHLTEKPRRRKCGISQKGAIKTEVFLEEGWRFSLFQYQKGAIKTQNKIWLKLTKLEFQYQKGAIKTQLSGPY